MTIKLAIVMDPLETINIKKDSTYAMIKEAFHRRWQIFCCTPNDLYVDNSIPKAIFTEIALNNDTKEQYIDSTNYTFNNHWYFAKQISHLDLREFNLVLLRKDPPFNMEYIYCTYILDLVTKAGVLVSNNSSAVRTYNEKFSTLNYPAIIPPSIVTKNSNKILEFLKYHKMIVVKPLDGMGGRSIFKITDGDENTSVIIETITNYSQQTVMAQKYIPEIKDGDKRILLVNGEPIPYALARIPAKGEMRGNLAAGATGIGVELTKQDKLICSTIGQSLRDLGLYFVGIDVIGNYLTEINVTCPTCIQEIDTQFNTNISKTYLDFLETKINH